MNRIHENNIDEAQPKRIGFLGCGKISEPMVRSLARQFPNSKILVSKRSAHISSRLSHEFTNVTTETNQAIIDGSDIVFLSLLADIARDELLKLNFCPEQVVISVMAGITLAEVSELIAPAINPCVTIPLPFIETGNCPLPVFPASKALEMLFGEENAVITVDEESAIGPHFAATAILSTTMSMLNTVSQWLAENTGDETKSETYVASLLSGYLGALEKDGQQRFTEAMQDLSTKGGLNTQLLLHNKEGGVFKHVKTGLDDLGERLRGS
ncbi:MAG: hypothetical protein GKR96_06295 [Gammaproteobacteria bacterium]|nr:hypothetical protein [Gammaproteobacteria bacterium]